MSQYTTESGNVFKTKGPAQEKRRPAVTMQIHWHAFKQAVKCKADTTAFSIKTNGFWSTMIYRPFVIYFCIKVVSAQDATIFIRHLMCLISMKKRCPWMQVAAGVSMILSDSGQYIGLPHLKHKTIVQ